jgi:ubiquinone/menaquinone biosynthesis C-methylase UbiE
MDVQERLSLDAVSADTLIATEHVHRYRLAAQLCRGLRVLDLACGSGYGSAMLRESAAAVTGVDNDVATIDMARVTVGAEHDVQFEASDAEAYLNQDLSERFDAIVCFEGLEHFPRTEAVLDALVRHAERGVRLIVSVPNSRTLGERNVFHVVDFGYDEVRAIVERFDSARLLYQYLAEGSLVRGDEASEVTAEVPLDEHAEPEYANHYIVCVNMEDRLSGVGDLRMRLVAAPLYNRYIMGLERANRELWAENARLGRERLGVSDAAAGAVQARMAALREARELAEQRIKDLEVELGAAQWRLLLLDTPRHRAVERLRERIMRNRVLYFVLRRLWALVRP